jgi:hypothetical protein
MNKTIRGAAEAAEGHFDEEAQMHVHHADARREQNKK